MGTPEVQFKKFIESIPILLGLIYFIGFIAINTYSTRMVETIFDLLNIQYLVVGMLCIISFLAPATLLALKYDTQMRTDNITKIYKLIPFIFFKPLFAGYLTISFLFIMGRNNSNSCLLTSGIVLFLLAFIFDFFMTSYNARNIKTETKFILYAVADGLLVVFFTIFCSSAFKIYSFFMFAILGLEFAFLGLLAEKKTDLRACGLFLILIMFATSLYSIKVLPNISEVFGGFSYAPISVVVKPEFIESYKNVGFDIDNKGYIKNLNLKFNGSSFYIIKLGDSYSKIQKDSILLTIR